MVYFLHTDFTVYFITSFLNLSYQIRPNYLIKKIN